MKLSDDTLKCLCRDAGPHTVAAAGPGAPKTVGLGFNLAGLFATLWPYILDAIKALVASGVAAPTQVQVLEKAHELAAAAGPSA